jgi:Pacifastin inhibitor (LCMII)
MNRTRLQGGLTIFALVGLALSACTSSTDTPSACAYGGRSYASGTSFPSSDGCNTCSCQDGAVACTLRACADGGQDAAGDGGVTCVYGGVVYHPGDAFPAGDGCNRCSCLATGVAACTKIACQADGAPE